MLASFNFFLFIVFVLFSRTQSCTDWFSWSTDIHLIIFLPACIFNATFLLFISDMDNEIALLSIGSKNRRKRNLKIGWALKQRSRIFHIVKHPDDLEYMALHNRSSILSEYCFISFYFLFCVGCIICSLTSRAQPIFIHWIFAAFQFIFLFFSRSIFHIRSQLFGILCGKTTLIWDIPEAKVQKKMCSMIQFHDITSVNWEFCIQSGAAFPFIMFCNIAIYLQTPRCICVW